MTDKIELPDEKLHQGHRARMRDKFLKHGPDIFDTYELLEMLLYYAVPYKDTNPIAKRLLMRFGSLDGVLTADPSELAEISGIGKRAAELIVTIGRMPEALCLASDTDAVIHNDYDVAGARMVEYFKNSGEAFKAHCAMLDAHPLATSNGKITEGYISLSPVTQESKYMAYAILEQK